MITSESCWLKDRCNKCDCDKFCLRLYKLDYLYNQGLISLKQRAHLNLRIDSDGTDGAEFSKLKQIENNIVSFVAEGGNLYIHSQQAGNGKTAWSLRLVQAYLDKIWPKAKLECKVLFINVPRFLLELKSNLSEKSEYASHIKENVNSADLVIWDDVGTKSVTTFESDNLFSIIDSRIAGGKSNIFTSNLNDTELHQFLGDRLYSRIANYSINIEFHGADKRAIK